MGVVVKARLELSNIVRGYRKPAVEDDKGQAERLADSTGNDDPSSGGSG